MKYTYRCIIIYILHNEQMRSPHLTQVLNADGLLPLHDYFVLSFGIPRLEPLPRQRPLQKVHQHKSDNNEVRVKITYGDIRARYLIAR